MVQDRVKQHHTIQGPIQNLQNVPSTANQLLTEKIFIFSGRFYFI
jgi:hypothetical protein